MITGGAGFIGTNLAAYLLAHTDSLITLYDNLSRPGVTLNLAWLKTLDDSRRLRFVRGDVRGASRLHQAARTADEIYHLAAPSEGPGLLTQPRLDFDVNVTGTANVLEAAHRSGRRPMVLFASTGKVYGALDSIPIRHEATRLQPADPAFRGVSEATRLDSRCPYACTKSVADKYVREYARRYDLPAVVFRLGCIAGPGQFWQPWAGVGGPLCVLGAFRQARHRLWRWLAGSRRTPRVRPRKRRERRPRLHRSHHQQGFQHWWRSAQIDRRERDAALDRGNLPRTRSIRL
jgi:nucleoside-diphosphate-sugar epimerase